MIAHHTKADRQLSAIAMKQGIPLPTALDAENDRVKNQLSALTGSSFDTAYMTGQVHSHMKMETLMKTQIAAGKNVYVVAFAKTTLPTVEEHLAFAKSDK